MRQALIIATTFGLVFASGSAFAQSGQGGPYGKDVGSQRQPGMTQPTTPAAPSGQGGYLGKDPSAGQGSAGAGGMPQGSGQGSGQGGYLGQSPGSPTSGVAPGQVPPAGRTQR
jgi:hypothetical protein